MTLRRNTVNIYDYPEHLNPFREEDDNCDKFNTTGRRRPSFRTNAWAMFSPGKDKSKTSEDITPQPSAASRFMTWTPKLLRRSFRRSSPNRSSSPWDTTSHSSSRFSFRTPSSRSSLPPSGSSRTSLPPPSSSPHRTTPPSRPAPPTFSPPLSPSKTENGPSNIAMNPVPPRRRALSTASSPGKAAGEKPPEDEVKYIQQGAKPKKKRRAPLPPQSSPNKSAGDSQQVNSNEPDVSVAPSSSISSSAIEDMARGDSTAATPDLEVKIQETQVLPQKENLEPKVPVEEETPGNNETIKSAEPSPEEQNGAKDESCKAQEEDREEQKTLSSENERSNPEELANVNGTNEHMETEVPSEDDNLKIQETNNEITERDESVNSENITEAKMNDKETTGHINGINGRPNSDECLKVDFDVVLHISEEDLRVREAPKANGHQDNSKDNMENETSNLDNQDHDNKVKLQNGGKSMNDNEVLQNEVELNDKNMRQSPANVPEPKPRTILPMKN